MATEKWVTGSLVASYTTCFGSEINSLASGNAILSSVSANANASPGDIFGQISIAIGSIVVPAGAPYIGFYIYPLNGDGSTYGDGRFGSTAAGPPLAGYQCAAVPLIPSVTQAQTGASGIFNIPLGTFKLVAYNGAGIALAASANTFYLKTFNRQVA